MAGFGIRQVRKEGGRFRADLMCVRIQYGCRSLSFARGAEYQREYEDDRGRHANDRRPACAGANKMSGPTCARRTLCLARRALGGGERGHPVRHFRAGTPRRQPVIARMDSTIAPRALLGLGSMRQVLLLTPDGIELVVWLTKQDFAPTASPVSSPGGERGQSHGDARMSLAYPTSSRCPRAPSMLDGRAVVVSGAPAA